MEIDEKKSGKNRGQFVYQVQKSATMIDRKTTKSRIHIYTGSHSTVMATSISNNTRDHVFFEYYWC